MFFHIFSQLPDDCPIESFDRAFIEQYLSEHIWHPLTSETNQSVSVSLDLPLGSTCSLTMSSLGSGSSIGSYALIGHHGTRTFGGVPAKRGFVSCGIVFCSGKSLRNLDSCGKHPDKGNKNMHLRKMTCLISTLFSFQDFQAMTPFLRELILL